MQPECQFCKTERTQAPCALPPDQHRTGIEIHEGPNREGEYMFTRWWWDNSRMRQRAQVFHTVPPKNASIDEWSAAWKVWRAGRPSWHI